MSYKIKIEPEVYEDIQEGVTWHNQQETGLGNRLHSVIKAAFEKLKTNPYFQIRYDNVRCFPLQKFPYMIHYTLDEERQIIIIRAVFHTAQSPEQWVRRKKFPPKV